MHEPPTNFAVREVAYETRVIEITRLSDFMSIYADEASAASSHEGSE